MSDQRESAPPIGPTAIEAAKDPGLFLVGVLRDLAQMPTTSREVKNDWAILEGWLGCMGRELTEADNDRIRRAWCAYLAIGLAPADHLQAMFDEYSALYANDPRALAKDKAPGSVMDVFDRMLVLNYSRQTTETISNAFRQNAQHMERWRRVSRGGRSDAKNWWRRQDQSFRAWAFVSIAWAGISLFYITVFDPLGLGRWGWSDADARDFLKAGTIALAPVVGWLLKRAYDRVVI